MAEATSAIVIDAGSGLTKTGLAGADAPAGVFATAVANSAVATDAAARRTATYPVERGVVTDWTGIQRVWDHATGKVLNVDARGRSVLHLESPQNPEANREKTGQIWFETYGVARFYIGSTATAALHATGRTTGLVLESGDGITFAVPVVDGHIVQHAVQRLDLAGRDLADWLGRLLVERGYSFTTTAEREILADIKQKLAYVALDYAAELMRAETSSELDPNYELPDGQVITIGSERFRCAEALFDPKLAGVGGDGIHRMVAAAIGKSPEDQQPTMWKSIVLAGGTTALPGLAARLQRELAAMAPTTSIKLTVASDPTLAAWVGASLLATAGSFEASWVTRDEFESEGAAVISRKCIP